MHLKRLAAFATWPIERKKTKWITRPISSHPSEFCLPINIILRDILKITRTTKETKKLLVNSEILVDNRRVKDYRYGVGLFDRLFFKETDECYTIIITKKNKLKVIKLEEEKFVKPLKIKKKVMIKKGNIQLTFHDGKTMIANNSYNTNDSVLFDLREKKIIKHLPLKKGAFVYIIKGKYVGQIGIFEDVVIKNKRFAVVNINNQKTELPLANIFVIDEKNKEIIEKNNE
jgi:small subunit ribosomal protein S4e